VRGQAEQAAGIFAFRVDQLKTRELETGGDRTPHKYLAAQRFGSLPDTGRYDMAKTVATHSDDGAAGAIHFPETAAFGMLDQLFRFHYFHSAQVIAGRFSWVLKNFYLEKILLKSLYYSKIHANRNRKGESQMAQNCKNIRPNLKGDVPEIHPSALIDPSAQIIGNVKIGKNVFVAPLAVIRADEPGTNGKVSPIVLEEECNIQDGVIIHSHGGSEVVIGARTSVAHGAAIHGPCRIGEGSFIAMRGTLYSASLENSVWVGMNATVMRVTLDAFSYVPAGAIIRSKHDAWDLRYISEKEKAYIENVLVATNRLREDYRRLLGQTNG
jgi:carbonic anhydrase/acetyltransferase-like protein (isoleucine patch superfamily)